MAIKIIKQFFTSRQISAFAGPAWTWNDQRQQFYLHQFTVAQPDLDYRNPLVLEEMKVSATVTSRWVSSTTPRNPRSPVLEKQEVISH